jgi:hypothetical protein
MFGWGKKESQVEDGDFGNKPLKLGEYQRLVGIGLDEAEQDYEAAVGSGNALAMQYAREELARWQDKQTFAKVAEQNPDTPVRWNRW